MEGSVLQGLRQDGGAVLFSGEPQRVMVGVRERLIDSKAAERGHVQAYPQSLGGMAVGGEEGDLPGFWIVRGHS